MDKKVQAGLESFVNTFAALENVSAQKELNTLLSIFESDKDFMSKVDALDEVFDASPKLDAIREITFDLLMINFFAEDAKKLDDDYLESVEWEEIENETLDRGTELLNVLLYIKECEDEKITPSLDDYLKEFLLVEEDEFQEEHAIYEDVIANQILMESSLSEIARVSKNLDGQVEIREIFFPMMAFFFEPKPNDAFVKEFKQLSEDAPFDTAILDLLTSYHQTK